ncbi:BMP family ABC transporter substrate-binding protein [Endozoicomonas sp. OPT23]|uniref:BMP family ABC transporter substrate-binding protein n=1 Tax=Endozoicomonas sp. OPT23 TaxID=2072845 RepID=UPI00129C0A98|nr:BMP family ABC transporter substrate-binding protein [Endozoicomonas sp. OPT23]MRI32386.1 BMP family ABC transporter substrate-binding protein [Endozoicomonas sp. OPT23]
MRIGMVRLFLVLISVFVLNANAFTFKPAVVYDINGKFDRTFSEDVYLNGVRRFQADFDIAVEQQEPQLRYALKAGLESLAAKGYGPIVTVGYRTALLVEEIADDYPDAFFITIDQSVDKPNVRSLVFAEQEGSYLVGALAAMLTETDTIGFIGGMPTPPIKRFECGYQQGANAIKNDIKVLKSMIGTEAAAFNEPEKGRQLATKQIKRGADVIYTASGRSAIGVFSAAHFKGIHAIGADSNQNWIDGELILTAMLKHAGIAVYDVWVNAMNGYWQSGTTIMNLKNGGIGWVRGADNQPILPKKYRKTLQEIEQAIKEGKIQVHDYSKNRSCSV